MHDYLHAVAVSATWTGAIISTAGALAGIGGDLGSNPALDLGLDAAAEGFSSAGTIVSGIGLAAECLDDGFNNTCAAGGLTLAFGWVLGRVAGPTAGSIFSAVTGWAWVVQSGVAN